MIFREENGVLLYQYQYQSTFCTCCNICISVDFQRMERQYQHTHAGAQREQLEHDAAYEQTTEAAGECATRRLPSHKRLAARLTRHTKLCYDRTVSIVQAMHYRFLPFTRDRRVTYRLWPKLHVRLPTSDYTLSNRSTRPCRPTMIYIGVESEMASPLKRKEKKKKWHLYRRSAATALFFPFHASLLF